MAEELLDNIGSSFQNTTDQAQAQLEEAQAKVQAAYEDAQAKAQAFLDSLPTPKELLSSIQIPTFPTREEIVDTIIPGSMTNAQLIAFLAPATVSLPGLDLDSILQLGFVTQFREQLGQVDTVEERQELFDRYYSNYVDKNKEKVKRAITEIKSQYQAAQKRLETLLERAQSSIARIANPPVLGTAAPNPTRTLQDYIDLKQQAENELTSISDILIKLILTAESINWDLPESIDILVQLVGRVKTALELIPTKLS